MPPIKNCEEGWYRDPIVYDCTPCRLLCEPGFKTEQECQRLCPDWEKHQTPTTTAVSFTVTPGQEQMIQGALSEDSRHILLWGVLVFLVISAVFAFIARQYFRNNGVRSNQSPSSSTTNSQQSLALPIVVSSRVEEHRLLGEIAQLPCGVPETSQTEFSVTEV